MTRRNSMRPFERSLPMQLMRAREAVMARFRPHLNARGLTDQQWRIIRALNEVEELEISELGERCCIHPASLSRILPNLEERGLMRRRAHDRDQRRIAVSLTGRGQRMFADIAPESEQIYASLAREIGSARLDGIYSALDEIIGILETRSRAVGKQKIAAARIKTSAKRAAPSAKSGE